MSARNSGAVSPWAIVALISCVMLFVIGLAAGAIYTILEDKPDGDRANVNQPHHDANNNPPLPQNPNPEPEPAPAPEPGPGAILPQPVKPEPKPEPVDPPQPMGIGIGPKPGTGGPEPQKLKPGVRETTPAGGIFARNDYRDLRPDGSVLIGFEIGNGKFLNRTVITYLRPIWLNAKGQEEMGTAYGRTDEKTITVKAKDGYAVGGIVIAGGGALEGLCLTFMKRGEKHLKTREAYVSDWYGEPTRKPLLPEQMEAGDGEFVIGFFGKRFEDKGGKNYNDGGAICTIGFVLWVKE